MIDLELLLPFMRLPILYNAVEEPVVEFWMIEE
jgi:hypothetical protein